MEKPLFIAEVSSNHSQDLERCFRFIDIAAEIGCDAVKFQCFKVEELFSPEIVSKSASVRARKKWELPESFIPKLAERCKKQEIQFGCTPFYLDAVNLLNPYVDFFKIASYELLWDSLLESCAKSGKPVILSTGMANMDEIKHAVEVLRKANCSSIRVLHCTSSYPTPFDQANLAAIDTMRDQLQVKIGWSDHTVVPAVIYRAVHHYNADCVEFHLDLDGKGEEFAPGHCWLPEQIKAVIEVITTGYLADGHGRKEPVPTELSDRDWRADPDDGLRPLKKMRNTFKGDG
jgi:sialic acid synthase SpsE